MQILDVSSPDELFTINGVANLSDLSPKNIAADKPERTFVAIENGAAQAMCSIWVTAVPQIDGERLGIIGQWADRSQDAAIGLLSSACDRLSNYGCTLAVGPMNGTTWRSYRFATSGSDCPPFFLEPTNPQSWPEHFVMAGFSPLANYSTALTTDLSWSDPRLNRVDDRLTEHGVTLRQFDMTQFDDELAKIYNLSTDSFSNNFLYTPIEQNEFLELYQKARSFVDPRLVMLAEDAGELVGYIFALPDIAQKLRGEKIDTIIIKTLAVKPGRLYAGLGALLAEKCTHAAAQLGYKNAIHALMHDANHSRSISSHTAKTIRKYTLFARHIGA